MKESIPKENRETWNKLKEHFTKDAAEMWASAEKKAQDMGHSHVGPEHLLLSFFESKCDLGNLIIAEFMGTLDRFTGKIEELTRNKTYDRSVTENFLKSAQKEANISFSSDIDVSHLLIAAVRSGTENENAAAAAIKSFGINIEWFVKMVRFPRSLKKTAPQQYTTAGSILAGTGRETAVPGRSVLDKYGRDLTALARSNSLDPVTLREKEIEDIVEILSRRVKSNPLLVGEPGVGKSALMIGLAQRIIEGNVPPKLKNTRIFELNLTSVIAGASLQGEFEKRMSNIIDFVKQEKNIILFIDEIHTLVGTGGPAGLGDAANLLKAPLVNGDIRCIGATTMKEYRKYIERDLALARRFQTVEIPEPSQHDTVGIIKSIKHLYEEFHKVVLPDEVIMRAVELSVLHIRDQFLPDKAIDLIDQACAHVGLSDRPPGAKVVNIEDVAVVLSHKTKIPLEKLTSDKLAQLLNLEQLLKKKVVGQDAAIDKVGDIIRLNKSHLGLKPSRPDGVFLFIGPTGVGKTELARVLAETLFDDQGKMIRLDMSEYMEPHSVAKIIGSPPGYIGSDQEGGLTGRVRTEPYSIILLDEVEKAHPDVLNVFLQVFEDGRLTDSQGRTVYFSNATVIMTSNIGAAQAFEKKREIGFAEQAKIDYARTERVLREAVGKYFSPEFINRIDEIVYFHPLDKKSIVKIARMRLDEVRDRFAKVDKEIIITDEVLDLVSEKGYNPEFGARFLNRTIEDTVLKPLSKMLLANQDVRRFTVSVNKKGQIVIAGGVD